MLARSRGWFAALLLLLPASVAAQKIGFVDSRKIMNDMPARASTEASLKVEYDRLELRGKKMVDSINVLMAAFEKDSAKMTQPEKVARFSLFQQYEAQYRDTVQALQAEFQQKQQEAMAPVLEQIRIALEEVRSAEGYTFIFDVGQQANPIVAMDRNLDLTDRVIARIRTMPAPRPAAAAPAPAPQKPGPVAQPAGVSRKP